MSGSHPPAATISSAASPRVLTPRDVVLGAAALVMLAGALVLSGWFGHIAVLKSLRTGGPDMKANSAALFLTAGMALLLTTTSTPRRATRNVGLLGALVVAGVAALTLSQYLFGFDLGIDQLLVSDRAPVPISAAPGRMAPVTALMFIMAGAALALLHLRRALLAVQSLAVVTSIVATLCCLSYLYGASSAQHLVLFSNVAVATPVLLLVLAIGVLAATPDVGLVRFVRGASAGPVFVRHLLPAVIILPVILGWIRLQGQRAGLYETEFGLAIYALSNIVVLTGVVFWGAAHVHRSENQRLSADRSLFESEERYRLLTDALPSMIWTMKSDLSLDFLNPSSAAFTGLTLQEANALGWDRLIHADDLPGMMAAVSGPLERGEAHSAEYRFLHHTGNYRWVLSRAVPLKDASGAVLKWVGSTHDIHDQKLTEDRLRRSERRYRALVQSTPQIVWTIGGSDESSSGWWADLTGQSAEELVGWGWLDAVHPEDRERVKATWTEAFASLRMYRTEYRIRTRSGEYRHFAVDGVALCDANGALEEWVGTASDITQRHVATTTLRESEARYRGLLETIPQIVWTALPDGQREYLSRHWAEYTGIDESRQLGITWMKAVHPDDHLPLNASWDAAVSAKAPFDTELRLRGRSGEYRWFKSRAVPFDQHDGTIKWFGTTTDIHDQKMIESELLSLNASLESRVAERTAALATNEALVRQFVKHSPAAIAMLDGDMCYLQMSDRWLIDYHLSGQDITGRSHYDVFPDAPGRWREVHQRVLAGAVERCDEDCFPRADGTVDWLHWECRPWLDADGAIGGLIMFTQVITERKLIEEQVRTSLREKEVLLKEIHHRVKNNLQIVSTLLDLQSGHTTDAKALEMFRESRGRVRSMALIHERLYRAKDVARVDVSEYVRQLADDLYRAYRTSDEDVVLDVDVDVPPIPIDIAIPCGLLLNELMSNCFKHAFANGARGRIHVSLHRDAGGTNVLVVSDTGRGFPAGTDFRDTESFGLQLVNTLVDQLHGTIHLVSNPGSTFTVGFPTPALTVAPGASA